jgi:hypothetical protein
MNSCYTGHKQNSISFEIESHDVDCKQLCSLTPLNTKHLIDINKASLFPKTIEHKKQ